MVSITDALHAGSLALRKHNSNRRRYKHSPLSTSRRQIRVLILGPGQWHDELRAEVKVVDFDESQHMRYEAVSHSCHVTVGDLKPIRVGTSRRLWVQPTVALMLQYLRYKDERRTLWVDQLCVDQDDLSEKSTLASMVIDVFKRADRAVVWLGPEGADSGNAFSLLEDLGWAVEFDFNNMRMRPSAAGAIDPTWADPSVPLPYDQEAVWSVYELIFRTWFGRLASRQEIAAKPANATVVCGFRTISWDLLRAGLGCFAYKPRVFLESSESPAELRFARRYELIFLLLQTEKVFDLAELLEQSRRFSCHDPLDRVYSVLNLAVDVSPSPGLEIDYTLGVKGLYLATAVRHMGYTKTLNILSSCEATANSLAMAQMPSWVPDWTRKRATSAMPPHFSSANSEAYFELDGSTLRVQAIKCGVVESAVDLFSDALPLPRAMAAIRRCAPLDTLTAPYDSRCSLLEAYCSTLAWGLFDRLYAPPVESYPNFEASVAALSRLLAMPSNPGAIGNAAAGTPEADLVTYVTHAMVSCKGRAVFGMTGGLLGLGPKEIQPEDQIWVLLGCDVPLVLRPVAGTSGDALAFHVVGDCYVHGMMAGEAILGEIPSGHRYVETSPTGPSVVKTHVPVIADADVVPATHADSEDPRLESLRTKLRHINMDNASLTPNELLRPSVLRSAGVKLQEIQLI